MYGEEGYQAANSSDIAISQFKHLRGLLFKHGRWTVRRLGYFLLLFLYKIILNIMPEFYYCFYSGFTGQSLYDEWYLIMYNLIRPL